MGDETTDPGGSPSNPSTPPALPGRRPVLPTRGRIPHEGYRKLYAFGVALVVTGSLPFLGHLAGLAPADLTTTQQTILGLFAVLVGGNVGKSWLGDGQP